MKVIEASHVSRTLKGEVPVRLVSDASISVGKGEFVVITGPSGSGKSSLLYLLGLLDTPSEGKLYLQGNLVSGLKDNDLATVRLTSIGFIFQFHFLLPEFSASENVMIPMRRLGKLGEADINSRAKTLLTLLGLEGHSHKRPKQLSGGQSQRVAIARALANEPALILADEPTGNLDSESGSRVRQILRRLATEEERAVVVVSHDPRFLEVADRHVVIVDGKITA